MPLYETIFAIKPEVTEEEGEKLLEDVKNFIVDERGEIKDVNQLGMRRFAYKVEKVKEGFFSVINFQTESSRVREIQQFLKARDQIIRLMIVKRKGLLNRQEEENDES